MQTLRKAGSGERARAFPRMSAAAEAIAHTAPAYHGWAAARAAVADDDHHHHHHHHQQQQQQQQQQRHGTWHEWTVVEEETHGRVPAQGWWWDP